MTTESVRQIKQFLRGRNTLEAPAVELIDPEVRTDMNFRVGKSGATNVRARIRAGAHVGMFIVEWGYDVVADQRDAFHKWLAKNENRLASSPPRGVHYKGTFVVFMSSEMTSGRYRTLWAFDSLGDMERLGSGSKKFMRLLQELTSFRDQSREAGFKQEIYQTAAGTKGY